MTQTWREWSFSNLSQTNKQEKEKVPISTVLFTCTRDVGIKDAIESENRMV